MRKHGPISPPGRLAWPPVAAFLLAILGGPPAARAVDLSGDLSGSLPAAIYRITGDIRVPSGQTLTLAPGVVFEFEDSFWEQYEFDVEGTLVAAGTAAQRIVFRAASGVSEFNYLRLAGAGSRLTHCLIEDAGSVSLAAEGGLWVDDCSPLIEACEVRSGGWHGIYVSGASARPTIAGCDVHDNAADGIDGEQGAGLTIVNTTVRRNGGDGICLGDGPNELVGCLVHDNGEDGVDSHGTTGYGAILVNDTIGRHPGDELSDASLYRLYNCLVVGPYVSAGAVEHSYLIDDLGFFRFLDPGNGDYRLAADSPALDAGTRFGPPATLLRPLDLAGQPRRNGIVDLGAHEAAYAPDPGTDGRFFSRLLVEPILTQPVVRTPGETFVARIAKLGAYDPGHVSARLLDPQGNLRELTVLGIAATDLVPGCELSTRLYAPGLETIQEITLRVPGGVAADFYGLQIDLGPHRYGSVNAVRILDAYPDAYRFLHVTDTHVGYDAEARTAAERLRSFVREANFLHPAFVAISGDVCENQNLENAAWADSFLAAIAGLRVPVVVQPGNHDRYNDAGAYNPAGYFRYFQAISRHRNAEFRFGGARVFALDTRHELGLLEMYRCAGPTAAALDWLEARLLALDPVRDRPRFLLTHGPTYDYFSWNAENAGRVRDLMAAREIGLALAGHTHRFETFRNEGDNWLGRNDYVHESDWGRDVAFPGFPLHVQTSSLGKDEHLAMPVAVDADGGVVPPPREKGLLGDQIGFRAIQVSGGEVAFFTADTDGDGHRNTEDGWLLGKLLFSVEPQPDGRIVSRVANEHHETWAGVRHYVPAVPGMIYEAEGGQVVRHHPDGTVEVAVDALGPQAISQVTLTPALSGLAGDLPELVLRNPCPNPFNAAVVVPFSLAHRRVVHVDVIDLQGRRVRRLLDRTLEAGNSSLRWDGCDDEGREAASGVYLVRVRAGDDERMAKIVLVQ